MSAPEVLFRAPELVVGRGQLRGPLGDARLRVVRSYRHRRQTAEALGEGTVGIRPAGLAPESQRPRVAFIPEVHDELVLGPGLTGVSRVPVERRPRVEARVHGAGEGARGGLADAAEGGADAFGGGAHWTFVAAGSNGAGSFKWCGARNLSGSALGDKRVRGPPGDVRPHRG